MTTVVQLTPSSATASPPTPPRRRGSPGGVLTLINGALAGVGAVYATTQSVTVTVIVGVIAVVLAALVLLLGR
jgi:hypothetical protein